MPYKDLEKQKESYRRYDRSDKGKSTRKKYAASVVGKEVRKKYRTEYNKVPKNKRDQRERNLKWRYNISTCDYNKMLEKQHGWCAICFQTPEIAHANLKRNFYVDHDHKTGKIRGLLCHKCNAILSSSDDSIIILQDAIRYLKRSIRVNLN